MEKVILWRTGYVANQIFNECMTLNQYEILGIIDNDISKCGEQFY